MRVCIIGPVNTEKSFGGVALFTESLADGFLHEGHEVLIITDYSNRRTTLNGTPIVSVCTNMARKNIKAILKIRNKVKEFNPDITVSSLEYSISLLKKKGMKKDMRRIHFVHGFPSVRYYGLIKLFIMLILDKLYTKNFEYSFVNSNFALMINNDIYKNKIDEVINIGLGYDFLEQIKDVGEIKNSSNGKLLYVGRLFDAKKVDIILLALKYIKKKYGEEYELDVVGNGPQENRLKEISLKYNLKVNFVGSVTPKETIEFYRNSEIFISLNPHEPFGMVYLEALANGCKIICPSSGGQLDFLVDYLDRVKLTNAFDYISVGDAIVEMFKRKVEPIDCNYIIKKYSYDNVAKNIIKHLNK
ncbi:Glycosyltransferase involved in cell wall bisynthesis [Clostridium cochlearium]|uniref:Glycosyltransferase involved in cell wall bisynthesis n=1 Tax=Clostridium cochlearium TaxID=1494 RepID=A0ABY0QMN3_CLOCO|nr:glycosyltransferase family 4 protein [Clostridium cochlearium]SDL28458.1 Glycosyltransferase involved in cell wall bisynthesis [Clostridium cochlearium]